MKTHYVIFLGLVLLVLDIHAQPMTDLERLQVSDSVLVEVYVEIHGEQKENSPDFFDLYERFKEGKIDTSRLYTLIEHKVKRTYTYSFVLQKREGENYLFKGYFERGQEDYMRKHKEERYKQYDMHTLNDSRFSTPLSDGYFYQDVIGKSFLLSLNPTQQTFTISYNFDEKKIRDVRLFWATDKQELGQQIEAVFFKSLNRVEPYKGQFQDIRAKKVKQAQPLKTRIKGNINNSLSQRIFLSGSPDRKLRHGIYKILRLDEEGEFYAEFELEKPTFIYFFHEHEQSPEDRPLAFPIFVVPGEEIEVEIDPFASQVVTFVGEDRVSHQAFHTFSQTFMGSIRDTWVFYDPFGKPESLSGQKKPFEQMLDLQMKYGQINAYLEKFANDLGEECYYRLKTETIYSHALRKLNLVEEAEKVGDLVLPGEEELILSNNRDYYLNKLGIRLKELEDSYHYSAFLAKHIRKAIKDLKKSNIYFDSNLTSTYYFARAAYKDIALLSLLKGIILENADVPYHLMLKSKTGHESITMYDIRNLSKDYKKICTYQPYLNEVDEALSRFSNLKKGNPAPDMWLTDSLRLSDFIGKKLALVFTEFENDLMMGMINKFAKNHPDIQFLFLNTHAFAKDFLEDSLNQEVEGLHFYSPGRKSSKDRPYYVSTREELFVENFYIIDEEGLLWGSERSQYVQEDFLDELESLSQQSPKGLSSYWEEYQERILYVATFSLILISFFLYLRYLLLLRTRKQEMRNVKRIETELRAIRSQMNPHFLFNSLSSVQNLINQSDKEKANHYLTRFSQLVRKVLNHSEQALIPLEAELKVVDLYCELEALRFKFEYVIEVDPEIDVHTFEVPSMLIQPYVENAVRHGLAMQVGTGYIEVYVRKEEDYLEVEILDNGIGIRKHQEEYAGHVEKSGFGLRLSEERIVKINERYKMDLAVELQDRRDDLEPSHGTRVLINIPIEA